VSSQPQLPEWESLLIDEAISTAEARFRDEREKAKRRSMELNRQQGYHRLAVAIDRPVKPADQHPGQLSFFPTDPTLFDDPA
jgi:hypothetical protein